MILLNEVTDLDQGIVISITGYVIVFFALLLLYYSFMGVSKLLQYNVKKKLIKLGKMPHIREDQSFEIPGQVVAAIAMTIYLSRELHDDESNLLTIKKASKTYSPWSSKIYGLQDFKR
jgi:Na+-transporting methylmalonyl-CoA/oxaloacetate decarboxylase gamma subunit